MNKNEQKEFNRLKRNCPQWTKWIATDFDGTVCAYNRKPKIDKLGFWRIDDKTNFEQIGESEIFKTNWRKSLYATEF